MDENKTVQEQFEEVLREKINELSCVDIESENAKNSAEALSKLVDTHVRLEEANKSKKEKIFKTISAVAAPILAFVGVVVGAAIKAVSDQKMMSAQLDYLHDEHERAYNWEENGTVEHLVTSPAAREVLKERPGKFR